MRDLLDDRDILSGKSNDDKDPFEALEAEPTPEGHARETWLVPVAGVSKLRNQ